MGLCDCCGVGSSVCVCVCELGGERRERRECLLKIALSDYETAYETPPAASVWITLIVWFLCVFFSKAEV